MVLLFDLDNTLIDSDAAYRSALGAIGIDQASSEFLGARARVKQRLGEGHVSARNRLLYLKQRAEDQAHASPSQILDQMERYEGALEAEVKRQWQRLERGVLLGKLTRNGPTAIVSDENARTQLIKLRAVDPDAAFFRWVVTSEEVGAEKPGGRPFEEALSRIGCLASECVMVGDSLEADVLPARRLGMRAILTTEFTGSRSQVPEGIEVIARLEDLPAVLAR